MVLQFYNYIIVNKTDALHKLTICNFTNSHPIAVYECCKSRAKT